MQAQNLKTPLPPSLPNHLHGCVSTRGLRSSSGGRLVEIVMWALFAVEFLLKTPSLPLTRARAT